MQRTRVWLMGVLCGFLWAGAAAAGEIPKGVKWTLDTPKISGARGETVKVKVTGVIPAGWHTYSLAPTDAGMPTRFEVSPKELLTLNGKIEHPAPEIHKDKTTGQDVEWFEGTVTFTIPVKILADAKPGEHKGQIGAASMMCDESRCLPPKTVPLELTVTVTDAPPVKEEPAPTAPAPGKSDATPPAVNPASPAQAASPAVAPVQDEDMKKIADAKKEGLFSYILVSLGAGLLALMTPCVFPMIPITISFFSKRQKATRAETIREALLYAAGIILTFTGLGFGFALLLGASGISDFAANKWVNLGIAFIFTVLALSLFGYFELQLPSSWLNALNKSANNREGFISVLLMGLVFSLTSFTCTVPFVGAVMVQATQGEWLWPAIGMLCFSTVFATPFVFLAMFPALLKSLPKSGGWLNSVKVVFAFIELGFALRYLSGADIGFGFNILTRELVLSIWTALSILTVVYLLGYIQFPHDTKMEHVGGLRMGFSVIFLSLGLHLFSGVFGRPLGVISAFLPPAHLSNGGVGIASMNGSNTGSHGELTWHSKWEDALAEARATGRPIFTDYTGVLCTNCRDMEENVFSKPSVRAELAKFVRVKLYTDIQNPKDARERSEAYQKMQETRYNTVALPFYAIVTPDDKDVATAAYMRDEAKFAAFLRSGRELAEQKHRESTPAAATAVTAAEPLR